MLANGADHCVCEVPDTVDSLLILPAATGKSTTYEERHVACDDHFCFSSLESTLLHKVRLEARQARGEAQGDEIFMKPRSEIVHGAQGSRHSAFRRPFCIVTP